MPGTELLSRQLYLRFLETTVIFVVPVIYLLQLLLGIGADELVRSLLAGVPLALGAVFVYPWFIIRSRVKQAVAFGKGEAPNARLSRLFQLPRKVEVDALNGWMLASIGFALYAWWAFGKSPWLILAVAFLSASFNMLIGIRFWMKAEQLVLPLTLEEFQKNPGLKPEGPMLMLPRMGWHLAFVFTGILFCTLATVLTIIVAKGRDLIASWTSDAAILANGEVGVRLAEEVRGFLTNIAVPLSVIGVFMLVLSIWTAWQLGQRYQSASRSVHNAMVALADGKPHMPDWLGTDEFGDISMGFAAVLDRLNQIAVSLRISAAQLVESAERLGESSRSQNEALTRQTAALQETEVTAQEINQTARMAAQRVDEVLLTAERARELGRMGEESIERTHGSLVEIGGEVSEMANRIRALGERARQIDGITTTVKELADQSNMLALNAAIEAVRSGEHGRGFAVVAREIRTLADQSIQATSSVRTILTEVVDAIRVVVNLTESGSEKVQASIGEAQTSGESLKELSGIFRSNADNMRQISASVAQQSAGITQIFVAVSDLARIMDETVSQVSAADDSAKMVRQVADDVTDLVVRYGISNQQEVKPAPRTGPQRSVA